MICVDANRIIRWQNRGMLRHDLTHALDWQLFKEAGYRERWSPLVGAQSQHGVEIALDSCQDLGLRLQYPQQVRVDLFDRVGDVPEHRPPIRKS
jgi:hypothetical protein